ncbi:MAG: hypothetical protein QOH62_2407 [Solirubrobacteraceae bacterium]|jgi:hypothetical protein|nr:hypothetical protein [Solirubrobacteraceae bacterium]
MSRRHLAAAFATGALALAVPVSGASAQSPGYPLPQPPSANSALGGNEIGSAGCVGPNRPALGGNTAGTSAETCGALLSFTGPQIGQIASVMGPTVIGSPFAQVNVSAGSVTEVGTTSG